MKPPKYRNNQEAVEHARLLSARIHPSRKWEPLHRLPKVVGDPADEHWENDLYLVGVYRRDVHKLDGPKSGKPAWPLDDRVWVRLGVSTHDGQPRHDWREFQRIKNDILGPEWEAIELYPAESRLIDPSNYFYLFCTPTPLPIGQNCARFFLGPKDAIAPQRDWHKDDVPKDIMVPKDNTPANLGALVDDLYPRP